MLGLRYFTMLCNDAEYKNMDQDESLGQLNDVQIQLKIFYKQSGRAYSFSTTIYLTNPRKTWSSYCFLFLIALMLSDMVLLVEKSIHRTNQIKNAKKQ